MSLPRELEAIRDEAMAISCEGWAIQKRWQLSPGIDRAGPCPVCGGTDRFAIHTKKNTYLCRRCGISGEGVIKLVMDTERVTFVVACEIITGRKAAEPVDEARLAELRRKADADEHKRALDAERYREESRAAGYRTWLSGWKLDWAGSSPAVQYLRNLRGIDGAERLRDAPLKEYDFLPWSEAYQHPDTGRTAFRTLHNGPALLAAVQMPDDRFGAVHQTWIDLGQPKGKLILPPDDKGKPRPSKKVHGTKKGGAIRLYTPAKPRRIVMGEGIETTATALVHAFEDDTAYWAGVDLGNMAGRAARDGGGKMLHDVPDMDDLDCFLPPDWCEELVYLGEDDGATSHSLEKAWRGLHRAEAVRVQRRSTTPLPALAVFYVPPVEGGDLNELVRAGA